MQAIAELNRNDVGGSTSTLEGAVEVVQKRHSNDTIVTPTPLPLVHLVLLLCSERTSGLSKGTLQSCPFDRIGNEMVSQIHSHSIMQQDFTCLSYFHRQFSCKESIVEKRRTCWQTEAGHSERAAPTHWYNSWWVLCEVLLTNFWKPKHFLEDNAIADDRKWEASRTLLYLVNVDYMIQQ